MTSHGWFLGKATEEGILKEIVQTVAGWDDKGVVHVHRVTGPYNIMVEFNFKDDQYKEFRDLLKALLSKGIHNIDTWFGLE